MKLRSTLKVFAMLKTGIKYAIPAHIIGFTITQASINFLFALGDAPVFVCLLIVRQQHMTST